MHNYRFIKFKFILSLVFLCSTLSLFSQNLTIKPESRGFIITENTYQKLGFSYSINQLDFIKKATAKGLFYEIVAEGYGKPTHIGNPKLPVYRKLIEIPTGCDINVKIINVKTKDYKLQELGIKARLIPLQPPAIKDGSRPKPFEINEKVYNSNEFYFEELVSIEKMGIMRGNNLARLNISPFQYNPVTHTLRVITEIEAEVSFINGDLERTIKLKENGYSPYFIPITQSITNYKLISQSSNFTRYPVKYVIVADSIFKSTLQPFVEWKTKKGFKVIEAYTNNPSVGNTTASIKSYLQGLYNAGTAIDPAPSFILFVGDVNQVPPFSGAQTSGSHVSDLYYCEYTGDTLPDAFYGRFSATNTGELIPQIEKTIQYEKYQFPNASFLKRSILIAGNDAQYGPVHANGQMYYASTNYFNTTNGFTNLLYTYPSSSSQATQIRTEISNGASVINYSAHGTTFSWQDPAFNTSHVASMLNENKYPLMIANACLTNKFDATECLGESVLRANKKGAVGYIGGSNNTYWDEDFYWSVGVGPITAIPTYSSTTQGAMDKLFHKHGQSFKDWFVTQGQIIFAGNLAVNLGASLVDAHYYWEIYHLMGDPSLMVYLGEAISMNASFNPLLPIGSSIFQCSTEPFAYVGISMNGVLHGAGIADTNGLVTIPILPFTNSGYANIVITAQNRKPIFDSVVVTTPNGPYLIIKDNLIVDSLGNNNSRADNGEDISINLNIQNITSFDAIKTTVKTTTTSNDIILTDSFKVIGDIPAMDSIIATAAFSFTVKNNIIDQKPAVFNIQFKDSIGTIWNSNIAIILNAPLFLIKSLVIDDVATGNGNGRLETGENAIIKIKTSNIGHADAFQAKSTFASSNPKIVVSNTLNKDTIKYQTDFDFEFNVVAASNAWKGTLTNFSFDIVSGNYTASKIFPYMIGIIDEDFETGNFLKYYWLLKGNKNWAINDTLIDTLKTVYQGRYSAKSGKIGSSQSSELEISMNVIADDSISFYYKVSSELDYDFLEFYIDSVRMRQWSGNSGWKRASVFVPSGNRTFKWKYIKDSFFEEGEDCGWIDNIIFPPTSLISGLPKSFPDNKDFNINLYPNPVVNVLNISFELIEKTNLQAIIYNSTGQQIKVIQPSIQFSKGIHNITTDFSDLKNGIYFVVLKTDSKIVSKNFLLLK